MKLNFTLNQSPVLRVHMCTHDVSSLPVMSKRNPGFCNEDRGLGKPDCGIYVFSLSVAQTNRKTRQRSDQSSAAGVCGACSPASPDSPE